MKLLSLIQVFEAINFSYRNPGDLVKALIDHDLPIYFFSSPLRISTEVNEDDDYDLEYLDENNLLKMTSREDIWNTFVKRKIKVSSFAFSRLWDIRRQDVVEYFKSNGVADFKIECSFLDIETRKLEHDETSLGELFVKSKDIEVLRFKGNRLLKEVIKPSENFKRIEVLVDGQSHFDDLEDDKARILERLYINSLRDENYALSFSEIKDLSTSDRSDCKPNSLFRNKVVCRYISQADNSIFFNFSKK